MNFTPAGAEGVLPDHYLLRALHEQVIHGGRYTVPEENLQPASLDLRLGEVAHRLRCSFLPGRHTVEERIKDYAIDQLDLHKEGVVLEAGRPYLIPLKERLRLPAQIRGRANPKSSTGRADVFTRVITDGGHRFDDIAPGYSGPLYLEVVPLSFPIRVREDVTLSQLRLAVGSTELSDTEVRDVHRATPILFRRGRPVPSDGLAMSNGLFLGLDLRGPGTKTVGYKARDNGPLLDMTRVRHADPDDFWEAVRREDGDRVMLIQQRFYLLMSDEAVSIPPHLAAEMTAYDPTSGELRTHYAGFFDPGFGFSDSGWRAGSRVALEVRAHEVPFMVEHGQPVCKLTFERMLEEPTTLYGQVGSSYQWQEEALGKHFRHPGPDGPESPVPAPNRDQLSLSLDPPD